MCNLPKATIEWRVWNSSADPKIMHAWMAFMQSMHAWADQGKDVTAEEETALLPPLGYNTNPLKDTPEYRKRFKWLFRNLWFSDNEKSSLHYALMNSELKALSEEFILEALDQKYEGPGPKKEKPRPLYCRRTKKIKTHFRPDTSKPNTQREGPFIDIDQILAAAPARRAPRIIFADANRVAPPPPRIPAPAAFIAFDEFDEDEEVDF